MENSIPAWAAGSGDAETEAFLQSVFVACTALDQQGEKFERIPWADLPWSTDEDAVRAHLAQGFREALPPQMADEIKEMAADWDGKLEAGSEQGGFVKEQLKKAFCFVSADAKQKLIEWAKFEKHKSDVLENLEKVLNGQKSRLDLSLCKVRTLPAEIVHLRYALKALDLDGNTKLQELPAELWQLTNLRKLFIDDIGPAGYGPLPADIGNLTSLEVLRVGSLRRGLDGEYYKPTDNEKYKEQVLPAEISKLANLKELHIGRKMEAKMDLDTWNALSDEITLTTLEDNRGRKAPLIICRDDGKEAKLSEDDPEKLKDLRESLTYDFMWH